MYIVSKKFKFPIFFSPILNYNTGMVVCYFFNNPNPKFPMVGSDILFLLFYSSKFNKCFPANNI